MGHLRGSFRPELLAPAGDPEKLQTALIYGADAVYLGGREHNLRAGARGFGWDELQAGIRLAHSLNRKVYFCLNTLPREGHLAGVEAHLDRLAECDLDGLILADPGTVRLARRKLPRLPLHLSTQANTANSQAVRFWQEQGLSRVNLARELRSKDIKAIRRECPDIELEVFVHGAMCMALSGRCHLSALLNGRSANQGRCTHPCRFEYRVAAAALEERERPGRITWEVYPDGEYEAVLASQDLCLLKHLPWFAANRIDALKIEGRTKSSAYLAAVLDVYATAVAGAAAGSFRPGPALSELVETATRPLDTGFFLPRGPRRMLTPPERRSRPIVGRVSEQLAGDRWLVAVKQPWPADRGLEILQPGLRRPWIDPGSYALEDDAGSRLERAHSGQWVRLACGHPALCRGLFLRLGGLPELVRGAPRPVG